MPTFELSDGAGTYQVDAPDENAALGALHSMNGSGSVGVGEDLLGVVKTAPQRMIAGLAGIPADLAHFYADKNDPNPLGSEALGQKMGVYNAQTIPGQTLQKAVDFAPAVIGGPEGMATKLLTRVAAPAVASEIGGQVAGPYGEVAGALAGTGGATAAVRKFQEAAAARTAAKALPSGEDLVRTGSDQFQQARNIDLNVKPDFAKSVASDMRSALKDYDPEAAGVKDVFRKIGQIDDLGTLPTSSPSFYNRLIPPPAVAMNEIENVRKQLSKMRMSADAPTRSAAKTALETLTERQLGITPADVVSGDAAGYSQMMKDAVGNYGAGKRSLVIQGKQDLADLNAGTAGSGANVDNATRQAIKQLARPINNTNVPVAKRLGFNDAEVEAIKKAATGTAVGNTARFLGKGAPTGIVSAAGGLGVGHMAGGPIGAVALPTAGYIAKKIGDLSTKRAVAALDSLVRSRSPLAAQVASQLPPQVVQQLPAKTQRILRTLAIAAPGIREQISQPVGQTNTY